MWYLALAVGGGGAMVFFYLGWRVCWHFEVKRQHKELREIINQVSGHPGG